jgi:hypothetical protein
VKGARASIAVWTAATISLASAPNAVKPNTRSSSPTSALTKPRVYPCVAVRSTAAIGTVATR